ncbi:programmed cell death protein 2 [Auriculariales sp. MPI-PUGE-AT-0066]|nr:programmed cell death protein 2 [Auriculariales sp. MPI-PUGE-AT-0066]
MSSDEDFSDSDDELVSGVQTTVQLGLPDEPMPIDSTHARNPTYSRFGGQPVLLTAHQPPTDAATCSNCKNTMELLCELWCPLEGSPLDRVLYFFACSRGTCQRKSGSVRAWRSVRYNVKYAEKLERKRAERAAKATAKAVASKPAETKSNPFRLGSDSSSKSGNQLFGGGFGDEDEDDAAQDTQSDDEGEDDDDDESATASEDDDAAAAAVASLSLFDPAAVSWNSPSPFAPLYVRNVGEYLPAAEPDHSSDARLEEAAYEGEKKPSKAGKGEFDELKWAMEAYEQSLKVDSLFERFLNRTNLEPQQCLRYDFGGAPLPYQADAVYDDLFPLQAAPGTSGVPITKADFAVSSAAPRRTFSADRLPRCSACDAPRVFECQLMPNLINILKSSSAATKQTDEQRKAELERVLSRKGVTDERGTMEWGTCLVFSCSKDCTDGKEPVAIWREEHVIVQWEA